MTWATSRMMACVAMGLVTVMAPAAVAQSYPPSPHMKLERQREWTLKVTVNLRAWEERDRRGMPVVDPFEFEQAAVAANKKPLLLPAFWLAGCSS